LKILLLEYATLTEDQKIMNEGYMILKTLSDSFHSINQDIYYLSKKEKIDGIKGRPIYVKYANEDYLVDFLEKIAPSYDAALVIAPEKNNILYSLTSVIKDSTINLGSPPTAIKLCSDKLTTTNILTDKGVKVPHIINNDRRRCDIKPIKTIMNKFIIKPRFGCGSDGVRLVSDGYLSDDGIGDDNISVEYIDGRHISSSLIIGDKRSLFLTLNEQLIHFNLNGEIKYQGGIVPYETRSKDEWDEIMQLSKKVAEIMGCKGYLGIDFVVSNNSNEPYVVDINPRPTTSIVGINHVIDYELAYLLLKNKIDPDALPSSIKINGSYKFMLSGSSQQ